MQKQLDLKVVVCLKGGMLCARKSDGMVTPAVIGLLLLNNSQIVFCAFFVSCKVLCQKNPGERQDFCFNVLMFSPYFY